ncbi:MAG: sugar phosphate isomerase/epimerase [Planctomycetes bacterium]|nr:sugar phosphate isomerase/epimerase [Planctomycetota bacterium]
MSDSSLTRRRFLSATGVGVACAALTQRSVRAQPRRPETNRKAVKLGMVQIEGNLRDKFALLKKLGFDGVELGSPNGFDTTEVLAARDETELPIHGVVDSVHWGKPLSHPDPRIRAEGLEGLRRAMRDAKAYGATTVLLVPAVVNKEVGYREAYERSQAEIRKVLPLASELGVRIALENVWNQFLLSPLETARYIDELDPEIVGAYFDVGNVVNYGWPEQWIEVLGERILKVDVKEFSRKKRNDEGLWKGFGVELHEGDCDWPAVMQALDAVGYRGWFTAEIPGGGEERLARIAQDMDKILAYAK